MAMNQEVPLAGFSMPSDAQCYIVVKGPQRQICPPELPGSRMATSLRAFALLEKGTRK